MPSTRRLILLAAAPAAVVLATAAPASAASSLEAHLTPLNHSGAYGTAMVTVSGTTVHVTITDSGLLAGMPHAQHIHIGGSHSCPSASEKGSGTNGHLEVSDAMDSYGMIAVSLTTKGDTSANSGLAVTRFPVGTASYDRTFTVSSTVAQEIMDGEGVIVQHGVDYNNDGKYDGKGKSDLDKSLPEEATDPADCGKLVASSVGTGAGGTAGVQDKGLLALGGALVLAAAGSVGLRRRFARVS